MFFGEPLRTHRIPVSRGGTNDLTNLELRCSRCHKGAHLNLENEKSPPSRAGSSLTLT